VVEGFYGAPWTHPARLSMIRFLGANGFNTYVFAPKSDRYLRSTWRKVYPQKMRDRLSELIRAAGQSSVDFVFTLSPGLDISYSSGADQRLLVSKLREITEGGCNWVGILLDDIEPRLNKASDRRRFRSLAEAHVSLLNGVFDEFVKDGTRLMFCPTYYANDYLGEKASESEYLRDIGTGLARRVDVLWTGGKVVSTRITKEDVNEFSQAIGRKPFLWDNYPVNDYYGRPRLNIGPFEGRAPEILPLLAGYLSNPMNQPEASKIPLLTLRDYLEDPSAYSPQGSLARAARKMFSGGSPYDDVQLLVDCSRASPFEHQESEGLRRVALELMRSFRDSRGAERRKALCSDFSSRLRALVNLKGELIRRGRNELLLSELEPVVDKVKELAELGIVCLRLLQALTEGNAAMVRHLRIEVRKSLELARANRVQALGEIVFDTAAADMGLPPVRTESPLIEFCRWSLRASESRARFAPELPET